MNEGQKGTVTTPSPNNAEQSSWQFHPEDQLLATPQSSAEASQTGTTVQWTASEFIAHSKSVGWYILLMLATAILAGLVYLLTQDKISAGIVIIVAIIFGIFAARKPRELTYGVDNKGVRIGEKFYPYALFRSFSIVQEGGIESIWLMPLRRFMPIITIYFEQTDGEKIVGVLSQMLPVEQRQVDIVDKLMHRLRF